jgi:hypothetical protein
LSLNSTRHIAAAFAAAIALGACSGAPQQAGLPSSPQSIGSTNTTTSIVRRPHGMPAACNPVVVDKTPGVVSFSYNVKTGAGSYKLVWNSTGGIIDTIVPFFEFYNAPPANTRFDFFSGPNQNPTWVNNPTGWQGTDVQPNYWPAGTYEMKESIEGSISGKVLASVLVKCS